MDIRQMRQVLELCRCESFGKAARALGVSQPTLSRSIARLEDRLGVVLFDRSETGARPTVFGLMIASRAEELLRGADTLTSEIRQVAAGESGRVRIGVGPGVRDWLFPSMLSAILQRFPTLRLSIRHAPPEELMRPLAAGELDLVLGNPEAVTDPRMITRKIASDDMIFVARPDHPLVRAPGPHSFLAMLDHPSITISRWGHFRAGLPAELGERQMNNLSGFRCPDYACALQVVAETDAFCGGPRGLFARPLERGALGLIATETSFTVDCSAVCTPESLRSPVVREIVNLVAEAGRECARAGA